MAAYSSLSLGTIESISKLLGDSGTGSEISSYLIMNHLVDNSGHSTKWRRLNSVFLECQNSTKCCNQVLAFIKSFLALSRFHNRMSEFETIRMDLNAILVLEGLEYTKEGTFKSVPIATTLNEVQERVNNFKRKLEARGIHHEIYQYCTVEILQENYFHASFEAAKGLFERIRKMSGIEADGANLIDKVFSTQNPILIFNSLQTVTEKSEYTGFAQLLKGCAMAIRNPLAHEPKAKILWDGEVDAIDYLTFISMLHRKLDICVKVPSMVIPNI
ncbi:TIGR02391 family protein [Vitreoscilla massiliensis]|uniref:TIGR02391 family protein n=1 Tax=Vitreoscilla massiliensis TaxID=1689272 RepID=A0ABY4E5Q5_9NEIS|nr:TIGR02391 family protein [Vitreoscilla massiliensis]UOO90619.1 TIGR02391 family protein [Vitreoscilla massiliensis]